MKRLIFLLCALGPAALLDAAPATHTTISPDGKLKVAVTMADDGGLTYALEASGRPMLASSPLGLAIGSDNIPSAGWKAVVKPDRVHDGVWKPVWGKRSVVPDQFRETVWHLSGSGGPLDQLQVVVRAYNDGIAFRYVVPAGAKADGVSASGDLSGFHFAGDFTVWSYNGENHNLGPDKLSSISGERLPILILQAAPDAFLAVHEADLRAGTPMILKKSGDTAFQVSAVPGKLAPGHESPWRVIFAGSSPGALVDSHLLELLNPDPDGDFSWVRPGVATWDWRIDGAEVDGFKYTMSMPSWIRMVDFAAANNMRHLVLDANWYGPEFDHASDPVKGDKANDVKKLIAYGKEKGVGIWLYLNDVGGRKFPLEDTLAQYGSWGAAGVKYGFMRGSPEEKNARTRMITELCARHKMLVNFHDGPVHPYGQMRTWPNAVTREYNFAQLDAKKVFEPKTFVTSVFVNMVAGPLDMNNGFFDLRQGKTTRVDNPMEVPSTLVSEAARTLITFSGVTIIPDIPEFYQKYPDLLAFLAAQKMPWRESKTVSGVIGEHIVMARQSADGNWLVGAAANEDGKSLEIPLDFLGQGEWHATIVQDGPDAHYLKNRETLQVATRKVRATDRIPVVLAPGGGATVLLKPAR